MGDVRPVEPRDFAQLATIHRAVFGDPWLTDEHLREAYTTMLPEMLLDQPAAAHAAPTLVFEEQGRVTGFVLVGCRPVVFEGAQLWMATTTHLVVLEEARTSMAGLHLLREATSGPQDLTYVDMANHGGQRTLKAVGLEHIPALSMRWVKVLRPAAVATRKAASSLPRGAGLVNRLAGRVERSLPDRFAQRAVAELPELPKMFRSEPLTADLVLAGGSALLADVDVHPDMSDRVEVDRRLETVRRWRPNSTIVARAVLTRRDDVVGWYVADINGSKDADVLEFIAAPAHGQTVMLSLLHDLRDHGTIRVMGDLPMSLLSDADMLGCQVVTENAATLVKASNPDVVDAFRRGSVWMGALEGEFLLDPPSAIPF